jgi:purine nucleoside phosphorylase I, inosine and guanosine-specific
VRIMDTVLHASQYLHEKMGEIQAGSIGLLLGSGLGHVLKDFREDAGLPYSEIPGFPCSTVPGHSGRLLWGELEGRPLVVLSGRVHLYEGYDAAQVCLGVRLLRELGVRTLILTNAAGALNPLFETGSLMCLSDHINFTGRNPLCGPHEPRFGERFPDMSAAYAPELRALALAQARRLGLRLEQGVYLQVLGPSLETPAETRAFRALGADAVGMSTVVEAIAARQMGMRVLGIACLTNKNLPDCMAPTSHEQVLAQARAASADLGRLLAGIIKEIRETADGSKTPPVAEKRSTGRGKA